MRPKLITSFVAALMILIGIPLATAQQLRWRVDLTVNSVEEGIQGISTGDEFIGEFEVDPSLFVSPGDVQDGRFVNFDLTIGEINWNEFQPHSSPQFLLSSDGIDALSVILTTTRPAHPDLSFSLPASPAAWEVKDENDWADLPIFGGNFGGTYTVSPIPDCVGKLDLDWDRDVDGSDLAGSPPAITDLADFAAVFGSQDYCPRPEPVCSDSSNGWVVLKNDTRDMTQLYVADMADAWGETIPDTFLPADFPPLVRGALLVDSMDDFAPDTYYLKELPVGQYSILITRSAIRILGDGSTEEYIRVVYLNSDVTIVSCDQVEQLNIDASSYNAYDMRYPGETKEMEYDEFKTLLDNGRLNLVNHRVEAAQRTESERIYTENVTYVREKLEDEDLGDPEFLQFIEEPILEDDGILEPSGDNWKYTIAPNNGEKSFVITLGRKYLFAAVAETLRTKGTIDNERTAYITLYNALQAAVDSDSWNYITEEIGELIRPEAAQAIEDVKIIETEKMKIITNWGWIEPLIILEAAIMPPLKPSCETEAGTPDFGGLGAGTTDHYRGHDTHAVDGVFNNYFYPLKWYATCVKDQGCRGSCVAFAITGAIETSWAAQKHKWVNLSEQWLYYKAKNEWFPKNYDDGLFTLPTAKRMSSIFHQFLYPYEDQWIYNASIHRINVEPFMYYNSCTDYYGPDSTASPCSDTTHQGGLFGVGPFRFFYADKNGTSKLTNQSSSEIWGFGGSKGASILFAKALLTLKIPLVLSYSITTSFNGASPSGFIKYTHPFEINKGAHASLVTGYIDNSAIIDTAAIVIPDNGLDSNGGGYFIVRNSWGGTTWNGTTHIPWKDAGYIYIPYNWLKAYTHSLITVKAIQRP